MDNGEYKECWSQHTSIKQLVKEPSKIDEISDAMITAALLLALGFFGMAFIIIFLSW